MSVATLVRGAPFLARVRDRGNNADDNHEEEQGDTNLGACENGTTSDGVWRTQCCGDSETRLIHRGWRFSHAELALV